MDYQTDLYPHSGRKRHPTDHHHCQLQQQQQHQYQSKPMDTFPQSNPITLIGLSHCWPSPSASPQSDSSIVSSPRRSSPRSSCASSRISSSSSSCKSVSTLRRQCTTSSTTILHLLLVLALSTTTVFATATGGLVEAKKEWSNGGHHHHSSHPSSSQSASLAIRSRYRTLYACEGSSLEIVCEEGTHINLIRANFGRFSISVCNEHGNVEWSVDCMSHRSFQVIRERCSDRSSCNLEASVSTFGQDPCPRVHKYLEVHFNCTAPRSSVAGAQLDPVRSLALTPNSDNHSHHLDNTNRGHSPVPTIPPLVIFPEPLVPSDGGHQQSPVSTSTIIPRPHEIDLTSHDVKENDENPTNSNQNSGNPFGGGPIEVPPMRPGDIPNDPTDDGPDDDDEDEEDPTESGPNYESKQPDLSPYGQKVITSTSSSLLNLPQYPKPQVITSQEPTAKPPKPDPELQLASDGGRFQYPTHQPVRGNSEDEGDVEVVTVTVPPSFMVPDIFYDHCRPMYAKHLNWNWTMAGKVAMQSCPDGAEGIARWSCNMDGAQPSWHPHLPDMTNCSSMWVTHLVTRIHSHRESVISLAEELAKGARGKTMFSGDLIRAADIVKQLVIRLETVLEEIKDDDQDRRAHLIKELLNSVLNVASNLLEDIQMESWHELNPQDQRLAIGSMTGALESVAQMLADVRSQPNYNYVRTHNNILVSVHVHSLAALENGMRLPLVLSQHEPINPSMSDSAPYEVSAYLPYEALVEHANDNGQVKVVFMMYRRLASLLKPRSPSSSYESQAPAHLQPYAYQHYQSPSVDRPNANDPFDSFVSPHQRSQPNGHFSMGHRSHYSSVSTIVNSDVVGLIIASDVHRSSYDRLSTPLSAPLELTLRHLQIDNVTNGRCAFWDIKRSDWSTAGCETVSSNQTHTVCRCNHLTNFAVLMDISNIPLDPHDEYALRLMTRIGCAISIVSLALTLLTLSVYRSLKSIRNSIHKHLCACLLVAEIIFLFGIDETRVKLVCGLIAIALHYFFLAAFLWMFFEGLQLYTMLVQVFEHRPNRLTFYTLVAYGAPALLVIVAALVDPLSYGTSEHCWLRADNHFVWSFLGPALAVLLANALFLALAMSVMCRHAPTGMMSSASFAVHQKQQQQQQLKVYPSPLTSSPSYSIAEHSKFTSIRVWVRTSFALVVVLGLTWTFGVLYLSRSTVIMAYIFTLLNSLQGLFIFIFCCLLNDKVRSEYRTTLARGARRCFLLRPFEPSSMAFATKSSTDSTRSTSIRDSHHLMMASNSPHHLSQQHLYMQQPAASFIGSRNAGPRTSLLYLNELLGKSEAPTAASTPTADQPLITSQMMQQTPTHQNNMSHAPSQIALDQQHLSALQQTQLSQALSSLSQIQLPDDASSSDYGCRRLTQMIEHIYECIDEDPYVAKLLLPAIERSLTNHQARAHLAQRGANEQQQGRHPQLPTALMATLGRASHRDISQHMRLQPNSSYLSSGNGHHHSNTLHGAISSLHLPAIVRDNTANGKVMPNGVSTGALNGYHHGPPQTQSQQTVALLDGDQVRCCTLTDHKLCDHQPELNGMAHHMMNLKMAASMGRHHLASEC